MSSHALYINNRTGYPESQCTENNLVVQAKFLSYAEEAFEDDSHEDEEDGNRAQRDRHVAVLDRFVSDRGIACR